ncbi:MAG: ABC transporter permease [Xanthomonadales bacterium]|nr:ABC transporter permease [Xanthomonadales bacterium]
MPNAYLQIEPEPDRLRVKLKNDWVFDNVSDLEEATATVVSSDGRPVIFQCGGLNDMDIAGAWVLYDRSQQLSELGVESDFEDFKAEHFKFLRNIIDMAAIREYEDEPQDAASASGVREELESLGKATLQGFLDLGQITRAILDGTRRPFTLIFGETLKQVYETGVRAIPIVMIMSFLIGVVLAYQASAQLEQFGAKIFVVDLVTISILREMGVLLAAVLVAGRSGSAFAAALGTMKLNEEVDALRVLGLNPNQILVVPRVAGLLIALPMLTVFANFAGILGGGLIAVGSLDIPMVQFTERVAYASDLDDLTVGMVKAPAFALLIAMIGTLRGLQVEHSAEELGRLTTRAVVESIFLIIVADAYFTVLFTRLGI